MTFGVMIGFAGGDFELPFGFVSFVEKISDRFAAIGFATHGQQSFRRWVHMNQQQAVVHQYYGGAQAIKQGLVDITFSQVA